MSVRGIVAACEPSKLAARVRFPADAHFLSREILLGSIFVCHGVSKSSLSPPSEIRNAPTTASVAPFLYASRSVR